MYSEVLAGALPTTHRAMVIVRLRAGSAAGQAAAEAEPTGGLSILDELDRAGRVRAVLPLTPAAAGPEGAGGAIAALSTTAQQGDLGAASIIRLTDDEDVARLLPALNDHRDVEYASRVPARWFASATPPAQAVEHRIAGLESRIAGLEAAPQPSPVWNLQKVLWDQAVRELGTEEVGNVRVGVLDTGVDDQHPDLADRLARYVHAGPSTSGQVVSDQDVVGHGTHVAGTIAARFNQAIGTRGICATRLSVWKIFDDVPDYIETRGVYWYLVDPVLYRRALADCAEQVDVVNLSIGGTEPPDPQESALFRVLGERGVTVVAAMGNERGLGSPTSYPAAIPGVVAVGATAPDDSVASFSNAGDYISVSAPGVAIWSTVPHYPGQVGFHADVRADGQPERGAPVPREVNYAALSGTSMSAPHVTAATTLLLASSRQKRDPESVRYLLMASADHVGSMQGQVWNRDIGAGRLNLRRLILAGRHL
ncbi:MAG TPA: S8 family serine peptidase [Mycobacteriales bacterium]|nr:S8 family serine peptidase [Mycobacteriales bacterium]